MKKKLKRVLWGFSALIVLLVILFAWYGIKASSEIKKMSPVATGLLVDSIYAIKDSFVNIYLIKSGTEYIAIDGGNSIDGIKGGLLTLKICPDSVVAIFLTHTDGDHAKALGLFPKASIYISKQEEQMINGKKSRFAFFKNNISGRSYSTLDDSQIVNLLNIKILGIVVPGHTPGSMCFLVNGKYLFTGDALSLKNSKIDRFNQFFNMDSETAAKSMGKLTNFPNAQYIFTAHHGFCNDYSKAVSSWGK